MDSYYFLLHSNNTQLPLYCILAPFNIQLSGWIRQLLMSFLSKHHSDEYCKADLTHKKLLDNSKDNSKVIFHVNCCAEGNAVKQFYWR